MGVLRHSHTAFGRVGSDCVDCLLWELMRSKQRPVTRLQWSIAARFSQHSFSAIATERYDGT